MMTGRLRIKMLIAALAAVTILAAGCSGSDGKKPEATGNNEVQASPAGNNDESKEKDAEQDKEKDKDTAREVKTYVDLSFNDVENGAEIPDAAQEGAGFKAVQIDGNGWAVSANPEDWAAMYIGVSGDDGKEVFLENFAIETKFFLPKDGKGIANDGGIPLFVAAEGRYDAAVQFTDNGKTWVNLWKAGNVDGGPILSNDKENYPDRGWVSDLSLEPGKEYVYTIIGIHRKDEDDNEYEHLRFFIDDKLIVESEVPFWKGGFGLRGWQSNIHYDYLKVSDPPLTAPDGQVIELNDGYSGE